MATESCVQRLHDRSWARRGERERAAAYVVCCSCVGRDATRQGGRTVGDLVRRRSAAPDDLPGTAAAGHRRPVGLRPVHAEGPAGGSPPAVPRRTASRCRPPARARPRWRPAPTAPQPATPPGGIEVGDAPWRRAARMMGAEPGGAWETAPIPVVATAESAPEPAAERAAAGRAAVMTVPAPAPSAEEDRAARPRRAPVVIVSRAAPRMRARRPASTRWPRPRPDRL